MAEKKYYWLQLPADWFCRKEIKYLRTIAGGDIYVIIYLKMMLLSLENEGSIYYDGIAGDFIGEIALTLDEKAENISTTIGYLSQAGLLEYADGNEMVLTEVPARIGSISDSAMRKRRQRARKNLAAENVTMSQKCLLTSQSGRSVSQNSHTEKEIESETEKEKIDIALPLYPTGEYEPEQKQIEEWKTDFPSVDVGQELRNMKAWCDANKTKRKTADRIETFIVNWLIKAQKEACVSETTKENDQHLLPDIRKSFSGMQPEDDTGSYMDKLEELAGERREMGGR